MQTFNCHFTARKGDKKVSRHFIIEAADAYQAQDIVCEQIGFEYGEMTHRSFAFNLPAKKMPRGLKKIVAGAGPEES